MDDVDCAHTERSVLFAIRIFNRLNATSSRVLKPGKPRGLRNGTRKRVLLTKLVPGEHAFVLRVRSDFAGNPERFKFRIAAGKTAGLGIELRPLALCSPNLVLLNRVAPQSGFK